MSYQVLARKWRPQKFEDIKGQGHVTTSLQNSLANGNIGHAYLLTGTRGVGKTTVARLFAKALRCEHRQEDGNPCLECVSCKSIDDGSSMDVIEIDGASNNGVEHIRQLIDNVQYLPTQGRYKIYIVDEVHMLSTSAFNALLKTLEEPPSHVIFIFATTDPEKIPGTVLSRCQRFDLRNINIDELTDHLKFIMKEEGISFDSELLIRQIAHQGHGSARDALSLLEQVLSFSKNRRISEDSLVTSLGLARTSYLSQLFHSLLTGDPKGCSTVFRQLLHENVELKNLIYSILDSLFEIIQQIDSPETLKEMQILKDVSILEKLSVQELFWVYEVLTKDFTWSLSSLNPIKSTELVLQKVSLRRSFLAPDKYPLRFEPNISSDTHKEPTIESKKKDATTPLMTQEQTEEQMSDRTEAVIEEVEEIVENRNEEDISSLDNPIEQETSPEAKSWQGFLNYMHEKSPALAAYVEQGNIIHDVDFEQSPLNLKIGFPQSSKVFHDYIQSRESQDRIRTLLSEYTSLPLDSITLDSKSIDQNEESLKDFKSQAELEEEKRKKQLQQKEEELLQNPFIQEAQKLFNSKVDKVLLNELQI